MNRDTALAALSSDATASRRLEAARVLEDLAENEDLRRLQVAVAGESDEYVRKSLENSIARLAGIEQPHRGGPSEDDRLWVMVEGASALLLHELRPAVGAVVDAFIDECDNFASSNTYVALEALRRKMGAIGSLKTASRTPQLTEFDLGDLVREVVASEQLADLVAIGRAGDVPIVVVGDKGLLSLALCNGLRNAEDAVQALPPDAEREIIVSWGADPDEAWIVVLDNGPGLPLGVDQLWEIGTSSKSKMAHDGLGLPIARRAIRSLSGDVVLRPRKDHGVAFEVRWPLEVSH